MVGHSLWKASEVDSDQTLHVYVYIVKHDPLGPAKVMVGVSIALHALLLALSRDVPSKTKSRPPRLGGLGGDPQKNHYTGGCRAIEAATTTQAVIIGSCLARSGQTKLRFNLGHL